MYKKLIKDIVIYGLGTILPRLIFVLFTRLFTTVYHPEEFSDIQDVYFFDLLAIQLLTFGFETAIFRFAQKEKSYDVIKTALVTVGSFVALFLIIGLAFYPEWADYRNYAKPEYALFGVLIIATDTISAIGFTCLRLKERPIKFSALKVLSVVLQAVLLIVILFFTDELHYGFITNKTGIPLLVNVFSSSVVMLLLFSEFTKSIQKGVFSRSLAKEMFWYAAPIAIASFAYTLNENYDKINMKSVLGERTMGAYAACYKLGTFIMLYEQAFRMGIEPFFFKQMKNKNQNEIYAKGIYIYVILGSLFIIGIMANLEWVKRIIIGNDAYFTALAIVPIILLANLVLGIYRGMSIWYKVIDKTYFGMIFSVIGAIVTIIGNVIILKITGDFMVAAWTTLLAYTIMTLASYIGSRKSNPIPYNMIRIGLYLLATGVISFVLFKENLGLIVNNIILIIYLIVIFLVEFKTIKQFIKR